MKKCIPIFILIVFCMCGCSASKDVEEGIKKHGEQDFKTVITEHMNDIHGVSINAYNDLILWDSGSATASIEITVAIENGLGSMDMSANLSLDEECNIEFCSLCDSGIGYNGGAQKPEKSTTKYQNFILRKAEELTGFIISPTKNDNYKEKEITVDGYNYISIFSFIDILEMAGERIDGDIIFQLYAYVNPYNEEDLFIAITSNPTGEIYRYDHSSLPTDTDINENTTDDTFPKDNEATQVIGNNSIYIPQDETASDRDAATLPPNDDPSLIPELPTSSGHALPYLVWTTEEVPIYTGPGTDYAYSKSMAPGVYTIVEESTGQGAILWGKLKSGAGWIALDYIRLQDGSGVLSTP